MQHWERMCVMCVLIAYPNGQALSEDLMPSPVHLRTEYTENPLGLDTKRPRFLWWMQHPEPDQAQTAYQIIVADSPESLNRDSGLWDSGKVVSDNSVHVEYAGPALASSRRYYWKVRVWDRQDRAGAWSEPAWFETALLEPSDFTASWIRGPQDIPECCGFQTQPSDQATREEWVQVDLGAPKAVASVVLYPASRPDREQESGFGFPLRYRIELSDEPQFSNPIVQSSSGEHDVPNPGDAPVTVLLETPTSARYVRFTATKLYPIGQNKFLFALAEIKVPGPDGENLVGSGTPVTASSSIEDPQHGWGILALVDGLEKRRPRQTFSPLLRKEFSVRGGVARARAYASAMGYYELYLNGMRVGDHVLDPANTVRDKRVLYSVYDVTDLLHPGVNAAGLMLGHGWHRDTCAAWVQVRIEYADGSVETVVTDDSWRAATGPIVEESLYHGDTYDARLERPGWAAAGYDDADWSSAMPYEVPPPRMNSQTMPPIRVVERRAPVRINRLDATTQIVDFGQNLTGWVRINVKGESGHAIVIRHAELLYPDGRLNPSNLRSARATDTYILKGGGVESYAPRFTQHGFRYAEITGYPGDIRPQDIQAEVVHTDLKTAGRFDAASPMLNAIRDITLWSIRGNSMSHPTDCPQRDERMGWMGDAHLIADTTILCFDAAAYYENWLRVIADSQDEAGNVPDTAPHVWGHKEGSPPWAVAYPLLAWYLYRYYGDLRAVEEHYDNIVRWFGTLEKRAEDHIVTYCRYGDWVGVEETPGDLISTGVYYWTARILEEFAQVLGRAEDQARFAKRAAAIAEAFNARFWDAAQGTYGNGSQFSQVWPLYLGIATENERQAAVEHLKKEIEEKRQGHLATGILGTKYIFDVLVDAHLEDVAFRMLFQQDYPGWGYMLNHGATTLWELWTLETDAKMNSHNHQMFGSVLGWLMGDVGGINTLPEPGYRRAVVAPRLPNALGGAETEIESVRGWIRCAWRRDEDRFWMRVSIPPNCRADVTVPRFKDGGVIQMNGLPLPQEARETAAGSLLELGSGEYVFTIQ